MSALNILSEDLTGVSSKQPLLTENIYDLNIAVMEIKPSKDGTSENLNIRFTTLEDSKDTEGGTIYKGAGVFDTISLKTEGKGVDFSRRKLKSIQEATGQTGSFEPLDRYINKIVRVKIGIQPGSAEYPEPRNVIKSYLKI